MFDKAWVMRLPIRIKLSLGVLLVLLPLLFLQLLQAQEERDRRLETVAEDLRQSAQLAATVLEQKLGGAAELAATLAMTAEVRSMEAERAEPLLRRVLAEHDEVANIAVYGPGGTLVASASPVTDPAFIEDRGYLERVRAAGRTTITRVLHDRILDQPTAAAVSAIAGPDEAMIGVVKVSLRFDILTQRLTEIELPAGQAVYMTDSLGMLAVHTDAPATPWEPRDISHVPVLQQAQREGFAYSDDYRSPITGDERLVAVVRLPEAEWLAGVSWTLDAAVGPTEAAHRAGLLRFSLIALASLAAAFLLSSWFARPIRRLSVHAAALARGELDHRSGVATRDEVEDLAEVMDDLAARLEDEKYRRQLFVSSITHEMRNLLVPLRLAAQMGMRQVDRGQAMDQRHVRTMLDQAGRLDRLVSDLSQTTEIERGQLTLELQETDLMDLARAAVQEVTLTVDRDLSLEGPEHVLLRLDPARIAQVLTNLLSNAVKYSPEEAPIRVVVEATDEQVSVSVIDRGLGFDHQQLGRLFTPWVRLHAESKAEGRGVGLFVSKAIVDAHGGRMEAESPGPGQGSRFTFTLPRR